MDKAAAFLDAAYRTPMPRLPKIGFLTGTALALAFIADVTLAPALMVLVMRRRESRRLADA